MANNPGGRKLRKYRKRHGLSASEFARRVGATRPAVHQWEDGTVPEPEYRKAIEDATDREVLADDFGLTKAEKRRIAAIEKARATRAAA
jgi:transcriptional regulator with XRE-family HTH domain